MLRIVESQNMSCMIMEHITTKKTFFSVSWFPLDMINAEIPAFPSNVYFFFGYQGVSFKIQLLDVRDLVFLLSVDKCE